MAYAEVAVNSGFAGRQTFSYAIPLGMIVNIGQAVWAPFGDRLLQGIVTQLTEVPSVEETRELSSIVDERPLLSPLQIELARWLSTYYLSPIYDAVSLMLPPGFGRKTITFLSATGKTAEYDISSLNETQQHILEVVGRDKEAPLKLIEKELGKKLAQDAVSHLVRLGLIQRRYELQSPRVKPKYETVLKLLDAGEAQKEIDNLRKKRASKQADILEFLLRSNGEAGWKEISRALNVNRAVASNLVKKGLIVFSEIRVKRDPIARYNIPKSEPLRLTHAQSDALDNIKSALDRTPDNNAPPTVFLLHGVTGSGKTEVYLQALAEVVKRGKKGIALVPEISLTPQTIERFAARFPGKVAVLHSRLSLGERFDEWQGIKNGEYDVVIGPRSAIFAPQPNLGLIIIDEEHDWAYKQKDIPPYYHARDVALKLARLTGATVVMGSATPDVTSFYQAERGRFRLLTLPERVTPHEGSPLPAVGVIDMRDELKAGNRSLLSRALTGKMEKALGAGEQIILFLNRRGSSTFIQCQSCGLTLRCPRCEVALNYHEAENKLICHQCNYRMGLPPFCPRCRGKYIFLGSGIQKLEQEVSSLFPKSRIIRWDSDTTKGKHAHEEITARFKAHEADILIGTQMVASGLDLPQVTLVGVVSADSGLNLPDFRAGERTFQLLCQVSGRAGRGILGGAVVIQTYSPDNYAIKSAATYNYNAFYEQEIDYRRKLRNPPFSHLTSLTFSHMNEAFCRRQVERMKKLIIEERDSEGITGLGLIGPAPAFIPKLRGRFRWQLILRYSEIPPFLAQIPIGRGWIVDVDPLGLT